MGHKHQTRVGTAELLGFVCLVALGGATLMGCNWDFLEGFEGPCSRAGLDCDDGNPCTRDCGNYIDVFGTGVSGPMCGQWPTNDEEQCTFAGISGVCRGGLCGAEHLCDGVVCEDDDLCTDDTCAWDGTCPFNPVECNDADPCTEDRCDAANGMCDFTIPAEDGTLCFVDAVSLAIGTCEVGLCVGPCDSGSQEELPCPVEDVFFDRFVCCPGSEACLPECS